MKMLAEDARRKVAEKLTTPHEMARVLQTEPGTALPCPAPAAEARARPRPWVVPGEVEHAPKHADAESCSSHRGSSVLPVCGKREASAASCA